VFQVTDIDARNAVEKLVTEGVIDRHVQAVDGHGAFVEAIIFRDLRLCGTRKWIGRGGGDRDNERDVGEFRGGGGGGGEGQGRVATGSAAVETGNGGGVGAELALGLEEQDVGGQDSVWRLD